MSARDWQLLVDLEHQLKFTSHIAVTTLCLDIILVSESTTVNRVAGEQDISLWRICNSFLGRNLQ